MKNLYKLSVAVPALLASPILHAAEDMRDSAPIVVTGERDARDLQNLSTPALGVGISGEQIAAVNVINVEDSVRYAPSLLVRKRYIGDANAALSIRNMHTTQTPRALVMVDGFTISNFLGADFFTVPKWGVLAADDIARAEVIYGPASARYSGHSMGGAMLLETRPITQDDVRLGAQAFGQSYRYYQTDEDLLGWSVNGSVDKALGSRGGLSFGYRHLSNQGQPMEWRNVAAGSAYANQGRVDRELPFLRIGAQDSVVRSREDQFRLRGHYDIADGWELRGLAALLMDREDAGRPKSFLRDDQGQETFIGISDARRGITRSKEALFGLGLKGQISGWTVDLAVSQFALLQGKGRTSDASNALTGIIPDTGRITDQDASWRNVEFSVERTIGVHDVALGLSHSHYEFDDANWLTGNWRSGAAQNLRDAAGGQTRLFGLFAEDSITLNPRFTAILGMRYEAWSASGGYLQNGAQDNRYASRRRDAWSPKAALRFAPDAESEISGSIAWATRFPTVRELYQPALIAYGPNVGELDLNGYNPDIGPERSFDVALTAKRRFGPISATLSAYRQLVRDTIFSQTLAVPDAASGTLSQSSLMTNIGKVESYGADLVLAAHDFAIKGLSWDANLSWLDAKVTDNPLNPALEGNNFPRAPRWRANISLRYSTETLWDFALNFRHQSKPDRNIENNATSLCSTFYCVSDFSYVDAKIAKQLGKFRLSAGVDNIFNEKAFVYHPYPARTFVLGLNWGLK